MAEWYWRIVSDELHMEWSTAARRRGFFLSTSVNSEETGMSGVAVLKQVERGEGPVLRAVPDVLAGDALRARVRELMGERGATQAAVAKESGMSAPALNQWLKECYPGDILTLEGKLRRWVEQQGVRREAKASAPALPTWVATPSALKVMEALQFAQAHGVMSLVYGGPGVGKTTAIRQYQDGGLNVWVATMTPAHAGLVSALRGIAGAVGVEVSSGGAEALNREIERKVNKSNGLLVIDEAQHLGVPALEQIRSIHDATGIGIALVGNERVYARMAGGSQAAYLDRVRSRIGKTVRLLKTLAEDVKALAAECKVGPGCEPELQKIASKPGALRSVVLTLKLAGVTASAQGRRVERDDVCAAWGELGGVA